MKKFFYGFLLITLIILTTLIKNSTKNIDKKIFQSKENIRMLRDRYELVLLDYNFLTSPTRLMEYQKQYFDSELIEINIENLNWIKINKNDVVIGRIIQNNE